MIALVGYLGFWTALVLLVSAWHRSSGWNATVLIGAWLALCVVLPALANATLMDAPTRSGIELTLSQREVMNAGWDRPKRLTMDPFLARHPEYRASQPPAEAFSWPWYYAMHEAADLHVAANVAAYDKALAAREQRTSALAMVLPPLALSRALTHFAGTDLNAHLAYKASVAQYHEALKRIMYPLLFGGASTADLQVEVLPRHHFAPEPKQPHWSELLSIWVQAAFVLMLGLLGAAYRGGWPGWRRLARRRGGR
jgi:ABC-2 type transport system permease protein